MKNLFDTYIEVFKDEKKWKYYRKICYTEKKRTREPFISKEVIVCQKM